MPPRPPVISTSRPFSHARRAKLLLLFGVALASLLAACSDVTNVGGTGGSGTGGGGGVIPGDPCESEGAVAACYPGSSVTRAIGECTDGSSTCADGSWGVCGGFQLPGAETCNGLDDNCDGRVDEDCGTGGSGAGGTGGTGAGGTGGSGAGGTGGAPVVGLNLYHRPFGAPGSSFVTQPVSQAWTGVNAPPAGEIRVVEASYDVTPAWLFVVDANGMLYLRNGGTWLSPQPVELLFAGLDGPALNSLNIWRPNGSSPQSFQFTQSGNGGQKLAYLYDVELPSLVATPNANNPIIITADNDPDAAPQDAVDIDWSISYQTAFLGTAQWLMIYSRVGANVYEFDGGNFDWADLGPAQQSWLWGGNPSSGPVGGTVQAAWLDGTELYFLAP